MSITPDLRFHIVKIDTPDEAMKDVNNVSRIKMKLEPINSNMSCLRWTPIMFLPLNIFFPSSRPLDFSLKVLRLRNKMVALSIPFLLS